MKSIEEYASLFNMEEDEFDDIREELNKATSQWSSLSLSEINITIPGISDSTLERLIGGLNIRYVRCDHLPLLLKATDSNGILTQDSFVDWYLKYMFDNNEIDSDEEQIEVSNNKNIWSIEGPEDGKSWRCESCRVINEWNNSKCIACEKLAPHASSLPNLESLSLSTAKPNTGGFTFSATPLSSSASVVPTGGFIFSSTTNSAPLHRGVNSFSFKMSSPQEIKKPIDLRSDTVTRPSPVMRSRMAEALVGDDVFGDDPTIIELEARTAALFGKESALFFPSGTMANLAAIMCWCSHRGAEMILGASNHMYLYEQGGMSQIAGVCPRILPNNADGSIDLDLIKGAIRSENIHFTTTELIAIENTHNYCGGRVLPQSFVSVASFNLYLIS